MKNTKNFILVGATLLFSALSTCAFAQGETHPDEDLLLELEKTVELPHYGKHHLPNHRNRHNPDDKSQPSDETLLSWEMDDLRQQWDSLYLNGDAENLAKMYTEIVFVQKLDGSIDTKTRAQFRNALTQKFAKWKYLSYSSHQTNAVMQRDGTIRVTGTYYGERSDSTEFGGTYDRSVIFVDGKYKIFKHSDR